MLESLWNTISDWMGSTFSSLLESILNATIFRLFYYLELALCRIIDILYQMFEIFAGLTKVEYNGSRDYLINIFFSNKAVSNIYWGMALIGIVMVFGFAIFAVIRKIFDSAGRQQQSLGQILTAGLRSIFIILGMTAIMAVVLNATGVLMQQVNYLFNDPYNLDKPEKRTFTGEEYAAMGRVLATIGNYSVVESKDNRYNINLCFNDIRSDMSYLQDQGVFDYSYYKLDEDKQPIQSWQSVLSQIATSCDLRQEVKVDIYNDAVARSVGAAMRYLEQTSQPRPLEYIERTVNVDSTNAHLDRLIFLMGTFRAARNSNYNTSPAFDDALRGAYYYNKGKNIYNLDQVDADFNIGFPTDYIVVWVASIAVIFDLVVIILNCIARIFNMLFLYIIAPPVIAAQPLDGGGKTKQWMTAFLVQSLSVFGTVIAMRLLLVFLPIIVNPQLVLFKDSAILNALAKLILIYGGFEAAKKSSSILTGILADSAGWQAVQAGDMSSSAGKAIGAATGVGKAALGAGKAVTGFAAKPLTNLVSSPFKRAGNWWSSLGDFSKPGGGCGGGGGSGGGGGGSPFNSPSGKQPPSGNPPAPANQPAPENPPGPANPPAPENPPGPANPPANNPGPNVPPPNIPPREHP
ncbi:MAG: hypothetical protein IKS05_00655 [Oscillospiraceae bacterium]|nr:hypothetical protein [Oscillospiraceae bacterium]